MKPRHLFTSAIAAIGTGLIAASALAQQTAPPVPPAAMSRPSLSTEDRAAMMDARIAAIHAGLKLTPDQEKLWPPVEAAARDMAKVAQDARATRTAGTPDNDPLERMARMGDMMSQRGTAMVKVATAARPLYATLSDDQKRRLRLLMRPTGARHEDHHREHHGWNDRH